MAKSIEKHPIIKPGMYPGLWSAYYVKVVFSNGNQSESIKLDGGVRGHNCACKVTVDEEGWLHVQ